MTRAVAALVRTITSTIDKRRSTRARFMTRKKKAKRTSKKNAKRTREKKARRARKKMTMTTRKKKTKRTRRKKTKKNADNDEHMDKDKENVINHSHTVFILAVMLQNTSTGKRV